MRSITWVLAAIGVLILGGCQPAKMDAVAVLDTVPAPAVDGGSGGIAERSLPDESLLALGTLKLEGTDNAVTSGQATKLLTFWRLIEGGTLKSTAETDAVMEQIRDQMTAEQITTIETLGLTEADYQTWLQEHGIEMPVFVGGQSPTGADEMSEEERAALREQFQNMTEEERATAMAGRGQSPAEGEAPIVGGTPVPGGAPGGGRHPGGTDGPMGSNVILSSLIELLTERSQP